MTSPRAQQYFFLGLLAGNLVLAYFIYQPFFSALILAVTLAVLFYPLYTLILKAVRGRESLAALLATLTVFVIVLTPLLFFGYQIFREARALYVVASASQINVVDLATGLGQERLNAFLPQLSNNVSSYLREILERLLRQVGPLFTSLAHMLAGLFLSLLALYYCFKDGMRLRRAIVSLSPLLDKYDNKIFGRLHTAVTSVIRGTLVIALLQGFSTGVGLQLFGVPNAALWASVAVVAALIPTLGTALVIAPAVLYLFLTGEAIWSILLALWGIVAVGLIDNLLGPKLIERGLRIHPLLILLAVIGGITSFGPIGFIIGPLILSFFFALLDIYPLLWSSTTRQA